MAIQFTSCIFSGGASGKCLVTLRAVMEKEAAEWPQSMADLKHAVEEIQEASPAAR